MKPSWIKLEPLNHREIEAVEEFLAGVEVRVKELPGQPDYHVLNLKHGSNLNEIRKLWIRKIRGPLFSARRWEPSAVLSMGLLCSADGKQRMQVGVDDDYWRWLLVRAVATAQIKRFSICWMCRAVKYAKKSARNGELSFCSEACRARFHYLRSRMNVKDKQLLTRKILQERAQGIASCLRDVMHLREIGAAEGSRRARRILRSVSVN